MTSIVCVDRSVGEYFYSPHSVPRASVASGTTILIETRDPGDIQFYLNLPELGVIPSEKAQVGSHARRKLKTAVHNEQLLLG